MGWITFGSGKKNPHKIKENLAKAWGKSLAVRLPGEVARRAGSATGNGSSFETRNGDIVIRHAAPSFTLAELFKGKTPKEWRAVYLSAFEWGRIAGVR